MVFARHPSPATRDLRRALRNGLESDIGYVGSDYFFVATVPFGVSDAAASARAAATASGQKDVSGSASASAKPQVTASGFGPVETHSGSGAVTGKPRVAASGVADVPSAFTTNKSAMML